VEHTKKSDSSIFYEMYNRACTHVRLTNKKDKYRFVPMVVSKTDDFKVYIVIQVSKAHHFAVCYSYLKICMKKNLFS